MQRQKSFHCVYVIKYNWLKKIKQDYEKKIELSWSLWHFKNRGEWIWMMNVFTKSALIAKAIWDSQKNMHRLCFVSQFKSFAMKTFAVFCFFLIISLGFSDPQECGENEKYDKCHSHCETKCGKNLECGGDCVPGCACAEGYARNAVNGKCVEYSDCPPGCKFKYFINFLAFAVLWLIKSWLLYQKSTLACGENEIFDGCTSHCTRKCNDPHRPSPCADICIPGCTCAEGFAKNREGKCVKFAECPGYTSKCISQIVLFRIFQTPISQPAQKNMRFIGAAESTAEKVAKNLKSREHDANMGNAKKDVSVTCTSLEMKTPVNAWQLINASKNWAKDNNFVKFKKFLRLNFQN